MRILLAAAPHRDTFGYSMPPPGLLRLGAELERRGIAVELEDLARRLSAGELTVGDGLADAAAACLLARSRAHGEAAAVIGLSVMGATLPIALAILARIRALDPRAHLWLGGPGTTGVDRAILERFACVDAVVRGEGELTVPELCARVEEARDFALVAGVTWRDAAGAVRKESDREPLRDLGTLAGYAWHLLPSLAEYKRITGAADGLVPLDSGRGCVYDCSFCTIGRYWGRRSRTLPARKLADEVDSLRSMPGAKSAYLCHDIFGANRGHALAFCDEMIRRGSAFPEGPFPWEARARADHLDRELCERMGRAGCRRVLIGIESADAAVRERNQKGMRDGVDLLAVVGDCAQAGITPILSLILGLPGEDERALRRSLDFCAAASLAAGVYLSLHLVNPQPGCALGDELGASARPIEGIPPDMAWGAGETAAERELIAAHPDLFTTWSLLPQAEAQLRDLHAIASELPEVWMRYPRTCALLCALRGCDTLDLYRAWRAEGRSFEAFAGLAREPRIEETLRWEQARVRVAARGARAGAPHTGAQALRGPRAAGEVLACDYDLPALLGTDRTRAQERKPTVLAVVPTSRGVATLRISADVASLLRQLDGSASQDELERRQPGIGAVLERLCAAGLVELPSASASRSAARETSQVHA